MDVRKKILVVEDEEEILDIIRRYLEKERFEVIVAVQGKEGLGRARTETPDLIILDLMLPEMDGLEVIREIRKDSVIPLLIVSARGDETDRVVGLELGADDYVTKPFSPRELMARVKALLRRSAVNPLMQKKQITRGRITLDMETRRFSIGARDVVLTTLEFAVLRILFLNPGKVFSREELLDIIWGQEFIGETRTVDVHIKNLRKKLEESIDNTPQPSYIRAVRGVGYMWDEVP